MPDDAKSQAFILMVRHYNGGEFSGEHIALVCSSSVLAEIKKKELQEVWGKSGSLVIIHGPFMLLHEG